MTCLLILKCLMIGGVLVSKTMAISNSKPGPDNPNDLATRMFDISKGLDVQLADIMDTQDVNFTFVNTTEFHYNASAKFNPKGMGQLYNVTNKFIDIIQSKQAFPKGLITVNNGALQYADPAKEWKSIVIHYGGLAGLAFAGLLIAAIIPCVGLFFCCCRCAGHCGARSQPFDKKHDHCRKVLLSIILIGVATIILFGVVCAFVTNEYMQQNTENWPTKAKISLNDVELYLTVTKKQINTLLVTNYNELEIILKKILEMSGETVTKRLQEYSHAVSLTNLDYIVSGLDNITNELRMMDKITRDLRTNASLLDIAIRGVKRDLLPTLVLCKSTQCQQVINDYKVGEMAVQVEFNKLPNVTDALRNITSLMDGNIVKEVKQGKESFLKIQRDIQQAVNQTIPVVSSSIRNAGRSLLEISNNISDLIDKVNRNIKREYIPYLKVAQEKIDHYTIYRYYLGLGVSGILLLVLMCLTFGLLCGICGKRPDGYGDDCCNKGSGARFLMMAVWIIFLLLSVLMVITTVLMITGVMASRIVCEPLKNPNDNLTFKLIDDLLKIKEHLYKNNPNADINLNWIVTKCHANETIYKVLQFKNTFDLESIRDYVDKYSISSTIDQLSKKINLSPNIVILSDSATSKLNDLAQSGLSDIKFYQYAELLKDNITNINLENLGIKLRQIGEQIVGQDEIRESLIKTAHDLEHYHRDLVIPMAVLSEQLSASALQLQEHIKFNHGSMTEAIHILVEQVIAAQQFLNKDGPEYVRFLATKFGDAFLHKIKEFLEHIITNARDKIGKCGPVSNAYKATVVAACDAVLDPYNGFWISVGWCLILFIPTIVLCVKLSALYQKSDPYPGPLVESEYLYDAYADRDNIPLSSHAHDKKQVAHSRHLPHAYAESYDGPAVSATYTGPVRVADAHQGSSSDTRYPDIPPNLDTWQRHDRIASSKTESQNKVYSIPLDSQNWDFPNGGPPRYQPAPGAPPLSTEYERPPPYYYPGPGDRN